MKDIEKAELAKTIRATLLEDPVNRREFDKFEALTRPLIQELNELGYRIATIGDLRHLGKPWKSALPVLLHWLPKFDDPAVKQQIVRCLSVPWMGSTGTELFIHEFKKYAPILLRPSNPWTGNRLTKVLEEEKAAMPFFQLAWAIGNALSIVDIKGFESQVLALCSNPGYGAARQMIVAGLSRIRSTKAEEVAIHLLDDKDVVLEAAIAVGKMKSRQALPQLERLLSDEVPIVRREARKAIANISRH